MKLLKKLSKICPCKANQNLKNYCSIKIGGIAKYVCFPSKIRQLKKLIIFLNKCKINYYIIGNGTNIIFEDCGFNGVIICTKKLNKIIVHKNTLSAYAGANLFAVGKACLNYALQGAEFLHGIPASVGGACAMNAGAFGGEIKDIVKSVLVLQNGRIKLKKRQDIVFSYRHSSLQSNGTIVLKVTFALKQGDKNLIKQKQEQILSKRLSTQPYGTANAGSVFKRANNESAGKFIDKLGLKGATIGDIQISNKHANFFINRGNATSNDMHKAIVMAKSKVLKEFNVELQPEVIFVGG